MICQASGPDTASASKAARMTVDGQKRKGPRPARQSGHQHVRSYESSGDANESRPLAHGCTRPVGGLPSMNRAQHLRLGLNCLSVLLSAPPARRLPPFVPGPLIPVPKLSDLSRCMQVIFNDVYVAWLPINYRPRSACVCLTHRWCHCSPLAKRR